MTPLTNYGFNSNSDSVSIFFNSKSVRYVCWDTLRIRVLGLILAFKFEDMQIFRMVIHLSCLIVSQNDSDNGESPVSLYFVFMHMYIRLSLYLLIITTKYLPYVLLDMYIKTSQISLLITSFDCTPKKIAKPF